MNDNTPINICHLTSVHKRNDSRIFYKECLSLKNNGYNVTLIVADKGNNAIDNGISIIDIGQEKTRIKRILFLPKKIYKAAIEVNANIYHFHDPELLFVGLKLAKKGKKVIFDSHEDFPLLAIQRDYIPKIFKKPLFLLCKSIERYITKRLSGVISATDEISEKFSCYGVKKVETIKNYPIIPLEENSFSSTDIEKKEKNICYVGGLTPIRGIKECVKAAYNADVPLILAGSFDSDAFFEELKKEKEWENVNYLSFIPHKDIKEKVYDKSIIGLALLYPEPNHINSIPIKILEYMANGLVVIASKEIKFANKIIEENSCGFAIGYNNIKEVTNKIRFLIDNPEKAKLMAKRGRDAVLNKYNWKKEEEHLIAFYKKLTLK
ncbi:MAG: glycosyltransferase [Bacteroidales bacterium]|jgi:glycosyltransferase involved in cell wall biosynthesis|nr:glycosyltransferase [Bacteroidales bacterium]